MPYCYNDSMCQILDENLQLKNCIASMNSIDMSDEDYNKYRKILNKALDDTVNRNIQQNPKSGVIFGPLHFSLSDFRNVSN